MASEQCQTNQKSIEATVSAGELVIDDVGAEMCPEWIANMLETSVFLVPRIEVLRPGNQLYEALVEYMYHRAVDIGEDFPKPKPPPPKPNPKPKPPPKREEEKKSEDPFVTPDALTSDDDSSCEQRTPPKPKDDGDTASSILPPPPKPNDDGDTANSIPPPPPKPNDDGDTANSIPPPPPKPNDDGDTANSIPPPPPKPNDDGGTANSIPPPPPKPKVPPPPPKPKAPPPPPNSEDQSRKRKETLLREFKRKCALSERKYPGVLSTLSGSVEYRPEHPFKKKGKNISLDPTRPRFSFGLGYAKTIYKNVLVIARHIRRFELDKFRSIILYSRTADVLKEFCIHAKQWHYERNKSEKCEPPPKPRTYSLYLLNVFKNGDAIWKCAGQKDSRSLESVVLRDGQLDSIVADLRDFQSKTTKRWYTDRGLPHRRCYLFYGPPGTGKTSTIRALAGEVGLKACFLSLSDNHFENKTLQQAVMHIPKPGMLVIEDIDVLFNERRKSETLSLVTFSGLLNALDGLVSADGVLTVMTTNHPERLDPALTRAGRVDRRFEFKTPDRIQMSSYFLSFYPDADRTLARKFSDLVFARPEKEARSIATVQEHFIYTRGKTAEESVAAVNEFFEEYYGHSFQTSAPSYTT